ncbi:isomerase [Marmoricola endophyticus]|uniref:Isomerase n=1 Tax=Marmoricola endophyticus TaxID=2040280 RepID=A0A917F612_9ACTN|nr:histidine phosphatase family protein [Marmoricola endophyticus]GGF47151.1 isomerase [Marmoricola endophyticus]
MSDLACAATVLVARHGATDYVETWFSDEGGWLSAEGRSQARGLADALRDRRLARVWSSDTSRAVQTAELVAARVGVAAQVPVLTRRSLREADAGDLRGQPFDVHRLHEVTDRWFAGDLDARFPGGESGREVVDRYAAELAAVADEHRGETALVVGHQTALSIVVPVLTGRTDRSRAHELANGEYAELAVDADGWRLVEDAQ